MSSVGGARRSACAWRTLHSTRSSVLWDNRSSTIGSSPHVCGGVCRGLRMEVTMSWTERFQPAYWVRVVEVRSKLTSSGWAGSRSPSRWPNPAPGKHASGVARIARCSRWCSHRRTCVWIAAAPTGNATEAGRGELRSDRGNGESAGRRPRRCRSYQPSGCERRRLAARERASRRSELPSAACGESCRWASCSVWSSWPVATGTGPSSSQQRAATTTSSTTTTTVGQRPQALICAGGSRALKPGQDHASPTGVGSHRAA